MKRFSVFLLVAALACLRLCHVHLLWADEDYHLAAALNILHGKVPYRDFWYDKPPLSAFYYLLNLGYAGWPLRILDVLYVLTACDLAYRIGTRWWSEAEGLLAAFLLAFYLAFYLPSAVIPFAADALMLVPHLAAIYCALRRWAWLAGVCTGIAFLVNVKALFVLGTCIAWLLPETLPLLAGFVLPVVAAIAMAVASGVWSPYVEQVWRWGWQYAKGSPVTDPIRTGIVRTLDWAGFHAAAVSGAAFGVFQSSRSDRFRLGIWAVLSFAGVSLGTRFAPHYFLQLLPPVIMAASRGILLVFRSRPRVAVAAGTILLLIPVVRFGPRYALLASDAIRGEEPHWSDVLMDLDSRHAAAKLMKLAQPQDTLFVWGYRPDIYVYSRLVPDGLFSDSQPLTGVPADRHLHQTTAIYGEPARRNRERLAHTNPRFVIDGLSLMNPALAPGQYPELKKWLGRYELVDRTRLSLIYRRRDPVK